MKKKIITLVKGKISDGIIAQLLKNLEETEGKPFLSKLTLVFSVGETIEGEIEKTRIQIPKTPKPVNSLEKIVSPEVFDSILEKIELKNLRYTKEFKRIIKALNKNGQVFFPYFHDLDDGKTEVKPGDDLFVPSLNYFLISRGFFYSVKSVDKKRTYALYKLDFKK